MKFLKTTISLFIIVAFSSLATDQAEAKFLWLNPVQFVKEFCEVVVLFQHLEKEHKKKHGHPVVKNVFGSIWNNLITFID